MNPLNAMLKFLFGKKLNVLESMYNGNAVRRSSAFKILGKLPMGKITKDLNSMAALDATICTASAA